MKKLVLSLLVMMFTVSMTMGMNFTEQRDDGSQKIQNVIQQDYVMDITIDQIGLDNQFEIIHTVNIDKIHAGNVLLNYTVDFVKTNSLWDYGNHYNIYYETNTNTVVNKNLSYTEFNQIYRVIKYENFCYIYPVLNARANASPIGFTSDRANTENIRTSILDSSKGQSSIRHVQPTIRN